MEKSANLADNLLTQNTNFWTKLKALFALSKQAKLFLGALSVVAAVGLLGAFALQIWANGRVETANLTLNTKVKANAYTAKAHFEKLGFLLRSSSVARINIKDVQWVAPINKSAVSKLESDRSNVKFNTPQDLSKLSGKKLGVMEYEADFTPLLKTIAKFYFIALFAAYLWLVLCKALGINLGKMVQFLNQKSLPQALWQGYKTINPLYRHAFWIVFIACNVVFAFDTAQFLWGRESWWPTFGGDMGTWMTRQGRYTQNAIAVHLTQNLVLPVLNNALAFAALSVAGILLCVYLNITRKLWVWVVVGFVLALSPFTLARMYFTYQVAGLFIALAIGILGFVLAKKAGECGENFAQRGGDCHSLDAQTSQNSLDISPNLNSSNHKFKPYALCLLSIFCVHWGIASYQPFIDTSLVLLCGGIVAIILDNKGDLKLSFYKSRFLILSVILAAVSYKIVTDILKNFGIVQNEYNNQMIALSDLPERIVLTVKLAFKYLFAYDVPFMPLFIAVLFGVFAVALVVFLFGSKLRKSAKFSILIALCGMVVASQTHIALSKTLSTGIVTDFYGLLFLRVVILILVFKLISQFGKSQTLWQNLAFTLLFVMIWACVIQSLNAQKIHKLSMDRDFAYINRVVSRIEQSPNFNYNKQYCGVMFGKPENRFTQGFNTDILPIWSMHGVFMNTMSKNVFKRCKVYSDLMQNHQDKRWQEKTFQNLISRLHKAGILDKLQPFPHKDSVVVFENIIVFVASKGNLDKIRASFKTQNNGAVK